MVLILVACDRASGPVPDLPLGPSQEIRIAGPSGHDLILPGYRLPGDGGLETSGEVLLDRPLELEFLALIGGSIEGREGSLRVSVKIDGEEVLGEVVSAYRVDKTDRRPRLALEATNRIDLSPLTGERVTLQWVFSPTEAGQYGVIAKPRLRPGPVPSETASVHPDRPPILFICVDTLRQDHAVGEAALADMPNLSRLAERSVFYSRATSTASWTLPAMTSLFTGLFPRNHHTGRRSAGQLVHGTKRPQPGYFGFGDRARGQHRIFSAFPEELTTLGDRLQRYGYATILLSSNSLLTLSGLAVEGHEVVIETTDVPRGPETSSIAVTLLESQPPDRPVFMHVHYMGVHHWKPWYFDRHYRGKEPPKAIPEVRESYRRAVRDTDAAITSLLRAWDERFGLDESLVVFFSDHGEGFSPGAIGHGRWLSEDLLRVPLYVKYPDAMGVTPGENRARVSLVDVAPTVLDVLGLSVPESEMDGRSLLDLTEAKTRDRELFTAYQLYGPEQQSIRRGDLKLVENEASGVARLFDVGGEQRRVPADGGKGKEARESLSAAMVAHRDLAAHRTRDLRSTRVVDAGKAHARLRALGYVE